MSCNLLYNVFSTSYFSFQARFNAETSRLLSIATCVHFQADKSTDSLDATIMPCPFSYSILAETDYSLDPLLRYYCLDHYVQKEHQVIVMRVGFRVEEKSLCFALDLLTYSKLKIFLRKKEIAEDMFCWI